MSSRLIAPLIACALVLLAGCATSPDKHADSAKTDILTPDTVLKPSAPIESTGPETGISISPQALSDQEPPKPELQVGTGKFFTKQPGVRDQRQRRGRRRLQFRESADPGRDQGDPRRSVAGELHDRAERRRQRHVLDSKPIRRSEALPVLQTLLSANGISLVRQNGRYTVLATKDAIVGRLAPSTAPLASAKGYELRIFPLQYVSPSEMAKLLKPYARPEAFINIDPNRSLLVMAGTAEELQNYQQTIETFDVDWLKGMSVGVYTLQHVDVTKLLPDLLKIFGTEGESPLAGMFRFMPIEQTNALVVITPQQEYLKQCRGVAVPARSGWRGERDAALCIQCQESQGAGSRRLSQPDLPRCVYRQFAPQHDRQRRAGLASDHARQPRRRRSAASGSTGSRTRR